MIKLRDLWCLTLLHFIAQVSMPARFAQSQSFQDQSDNCFDGQQTAAITDSQFFFPPVGCNGDVSPCSCETDPVKGSVITCSDVTSASSVTLALSQTDADDLSEIILRNLMSNFIPENVFGTKRVRKITLEVGTNQLAIHQLAFLSTAEYTFSFNITSVPGMSLDSVDLTFLSTFSKLRSFAMYLNSNEGAASITTLPQLPTLKELTIGNSNLNLIGKRFPNLSPAQLELLSLPLNNLEDTVAESILSKVADSTSATSLIKLELAYNQLTKIPKQVRLFPELRTLNLEWNEISSVSTRSLPFDQPIEEIRMAFNPIADNFEPGCFDDGDYSSATIYAQAIEMTTMEQNVFKNLLEQMTQPNCMKGTLVLSGNFFKCDCNLAWLLRDNRFLLNALREAVCADAATFENTSPDLFRTCP